MTRVLVFDFTVYTVSGTLPSAFFQHAWCVALRSAREARQRRMETGTGDRALAEHTAIPSWAGTNSGQAQWGNQLSAHPHVTPPPFPPPLDLVCQSHALSGAAALSAASPCFDRLFHCSQLQPEVPVGRLGSQRRRLPALGPPTLPSRPTAFQS